MDWKVLVGTKVLLLILLSTTAKSDNGEKRVVCYYTNWSVYRPGTAKYSPQNINPYLCTHLIYAFGGFTKDNTLKPFDKYQDIDKGGYAKFTGLKTYNKDLKVLLAIGGWNEGSSRFSPMVADAQRRRKFVKNVVKFLRQNHFDGLDLDWEYPAFRDGGKPRDRDNYANLVQELREEFEKESSKTGRPRLLLTMAVPAGIEYIEKGYDIPKLDEYLDFINLLSYDYHSAYEPAVNHHSPLYPLEEDNEYNYDNELTIDYTIKHLLKSGATPNKIVIGIPTYGRSYTLFNEDATALGSPADGPGEEGEATREKGYLAYYEICEGIANNDWTVEKPNPKAMGPFAFKGNQWVGYDDEDIVRAKARYVNENKLGGIMFWSIDNDDFRGKCHGRPYPLIEAAKEALLEENGKEKDDGRPNAINTRKRNRVSDSSKSSTQRNTQKSAGTSNRKNVVSRSFNDKRSSSRSRTNSRSRNEHKSDDESNDENNEDVEAPKTSSKSSRSQPITNKNRFRTRSNINDRDSRKKQTSTSTTTQKPHKNKITTPEPPTTPDPGSDFKCEDEGFFPHPRDCKKYFWCLDSGPSGLGIVANQFTCPSGLVFNKLADSCDYPRNVVCPKVKAKSTTDSTTTTQRTTTEKEEVIEEEEEEKEEDEEYEEHDDVKEVEDKKAEEDKKRKVITTTARSLLYKTINRNRPTSTTTTTTTAPSTVGSARFSDDITDEEQDPKVIKELIELIKKAGGIEQLEKQLALQEKNPSGGSNQENGQVTPATISKSLYERVLSRQSGKSNFFKVPTSRLASNRKTDDVEDKEEEIEEATNNKSKIKFVNGPGRSQFEGLDEVPEVKSLRRHNSPKYVTIERHSSSTPSTKIDDLDDEEEDDIEEEAAADNEDEASSEEKLISNLPEQKILSAPRSTPGYINIRRTRPAATTELSRIDSDIKESVVDEEESKKQNVRRTSFRHTDQVQKEIEEDPITPKTRYVSANRFRSTTTAPLKETEQTAGKDILSEIAADEKLVTKFTTTVHPSTKDQVTYKTETTKLFINDDQESTKPITTQFIDEGHVTAKYVTTSQFYSEDPVYTKSTITPQFYNEGQVTIQSTTPQAYSEDHVTEGKTITVAGESGRISISPFSTETPSTARIFTDDLASTLKSSIPYTEEKFISTRYTTKQIPPSTVSPNPNTIDDSVTESALHVTPLNNRVTPTEPNSRVTLAAVSQPRPFGFPRRSRPKTTASYSETTHSTVTGFESTPRSKVKPSRNPGFNLYRRPGDPPLPRGTYTAIPSATLPPTTKIYPVQFDLENSRVVGLVADQNGNPQNLELILADPPASISSTTDSGKAAFARPNFKHKTNAIPVQTTTELSVSSNPTRIISSDKRRQGQKYNSNRIASPNSYSQIRTRPYKPAVTDYDYYDDEEERFVGKPNGKLFITSRGFIKCLDQGNFAHPDSCKKFISCAKMVDGKVIGTEYTCPPKLSFDPIGGMCNWSAGLGCNE